MRESEPYLAGKALAEFGEGKAGEAFTQAVLAIMVNTGLVSHMVEDRYNCALARCMPVSI